MSLLDLRWAMAAVFGSVLRGERPWDESARSWYPMAGGRIDQEVFLAERMRWT